MHSLRRRTAWNQSFQMCDGRRREAMHVAECGGRPIDEPEKCDGGEGSRRGVGVLRLGVFRLVLDVLGLGKVLIGPERIAIEPEVEDGGHGQHGHRLDAIEAVRPGYFWPKPLPDAASTWRSVLSTAPVTGSPGKLEREVRDLPR